MFAPPAGWFPVTRGDTQFPELSGSGRRDRHKMSSSLLRADDAAPSAKPPSRLPHRNAGMGMQGSGRCFGRFRQCQGFGGEAAELGAPSLICSRGRADWCGRRRGGAAEGAERRPRGRAGTFRVETGGRAAAREGATPRGRCSEVAPLLPSARRWPCFGGSGAGSRRPPGRELREEEEGAAPSGTRPPESRRARGGRRPF